MSSLNLHSLLDTQVEGRVAFLENISLNKDAYQTMRSARTIIRARLREQLPKHLRKKALAIGQDISIPEPRFFTQGSWAYKTLNSPCKHPQQADLDDGTYLPFSYIESQPPRQMSALLFNSVEEVLGDLANDMGWILDDNNPNCTRLIIDSDKHIDVPVYSIPDDEFKTLVEARKMAMESVALDSAYTEEDDWDMMPTNGVLMATKDRGWRDNDPRPIRDWVAAQVQLKGEQLRRIMRYLKAWRDHQEWPKDDPKSILLMVAVDLAFDVATDRRDDLALLSVLKKLPEIFAGQIINPATVDKPETEQEDLAKRLDKHDIRHDLIARIKSFAEQLDYAIFKCGEPAQACKTLIDTLGTRVPNDPDRVTLATIQTKKAVRTEVLPPIGKLTAG